MMTRTALGVSILVMSLLVCACGSAASSPPSGGSSGSGSQPTVAAATAQKSQPTVSASGEAQAKIVPCNLLTKADAEAILGEPAGDANPRDVKIGESGVLSSCTYFSAAPKAWLHMSVQVVTLNASAPKEWTLESYYNGVQDGMVEQQGAKPTDVQGIGDKAVWLAGVSEGEHGQSMLHILRKDVVIDLWVPTATPSAQDAAAKLAVTLLGRL